MTDRRAGLIGAAVVLTGLTLFVTWPQGLFLSSQLAAHHDALFSIWRISWIAHGLQVAPLHLFDANIFHPAQGTLAFSDATLLEGLVGAPLLWAGLPPTLVYNLLLLAGFVGSGVAMYVLSWHLTRQAGPALIAGAVFTVLPYRIEHFMHLELQWAMFIPLTWWALHRTVESSSVRWGAAAGLFLSLQMLACVYYGVFLGMTLLVFVPACVAGLPVSRLRTLLAPSAAAALVVVVLVVPFALPYMGAARELGGRTATEVARYSATLSSYFATSSLNHLWGWTDAWGASELRLFPGALALVLGVAGAVVRPGRTAIVYALVVVTAVELSFGLNGVVYRTLFTHLDAMQGFRATARFAVVASAALAVLCALGTAHLLRLAAAGRVRTAAVAVLVLVIAAEGANQPMWLVAAQPTLPPDVYQVIRRAAPGAILELPLPDPEQLPGHDPEYQVWSLWHWRPLVNGYSGYYPRDYLMTMLRMNVFPREGTLERLRAHDVRYIIVHRAFYDQDEHAGLMMRMASSPELKPWGAYKDSVGTADIFELIPVD